MAGDDRWGSLGMSHGLSCFQLKASTGFPELGGWRLPPRSGGVCGLEEEMWDAVRNGKPCAC